MPRLNPRDPLSEDILRDAADGSLLMFHGAPATPTYVKKGATWYREGDRKPRPDRYATYTLIRWAQRRNDSVLILAPA